MPPRPSTDPASTSGASPVGSSSRQLTQEGNAMAERRESVKPEENLPLSEILKVQVSDERVERLKQLTTVDAPGITDEIFTWLVRQQAQWANMQYARFLSGAKYTEQ